MEDDAAIASGLTRVLEGQGYAVRRADTGRAALFAALGEVDLVILDLGLPDMDGIEVCRALRRSRPELPVVVLTARHHEADVVAGLDAGADDYLVKPFKLSELLARIRAQIRRSDVAAGAGDVIRAGALLVDRRARRVWLDGEEIVLRPREFELLALLAGNAGRVLTRERIMAEVWDTAWTGSTKTLDMHVLALRRHLGSEAITTLRGVGYRLEAD